MTKNQAIAKLIQTMEISSDMLKPLGIKMDHWLAYCQMPPEVRKQKVEVLIGWLASDDQLKGKR